MCELRWQVSIVDPDLLSPESICSLLTTLDINRVGAFAAITEPSWLMEDVEVPFEEVGAGFVIPTSALIPAIRKGCVLDWFTFLFTDTQDEARRVAESPYIEGQIRLARTCAHGMDGGYYYIYTKEENVVDRLRHRYALEQAVQRPISELEIPY